MGRRATTFYDTDRLLQHVTSRGIHQVAVTAVPVLKMNGVWRGSMATVMANLPALRMTWRTTNKRRSALSIYRRRLALPSGNKESWQ